MKKGLLLFILVIYLALTLSYGVVNPLFEAPDEHWHFFTAVYIAENKRLPTVENEYDPWLGQEAAQPPLYYLLAAALITPLDTSTARDQVWLNPLGARGVGNAEALANRNQAVHTAAEAWPWSGYVLAAHGLRIFSTLLGLGSLLAIFASGRRLWPGSPTRPLLAVALVAFLPQFNFQHAAISNDPLIILLCSVGLWQLIGLWQQRLTAVRLLALGLTIGLAALSKNAGLLLLVYTAGFLAVCFLKHGSQSWQQKLWRWGWQTAVFVLLPVLLLAGWLWWRNWQLYGDWTATSEFIRLAGGDRGYTLSQVLSESGGLWRSLFAVFGWFNLLAPAWVYWVWNFLAILGLLGLASAAVKTWRQSTTNSLRIRLIAFIKKQTLPLLLAGWVLAVYAGLVLFMLRTPAAQGRLLFPAILPLSLGLAFGLLNWRWRPLAWLAPALALLTSSYSPWGVIAPAYRPPPSVTSLPDSAEPIQQAMGAGLTLLGVTRETEAAVPGEVVWFTLYWRAESIPDIPPELVVELLGRNLRPIAGSQAYHGRGQYPATEWPAGRIIADRVGLRLAEEIDTPVLARLFVRLVDDVSPDPPSVPISAVKVRPPTWPEVEPGILAEIGGAVHLVNVANLPQSARPGETVDFEVRWRVIAPPQANWTTLVHLAEPGQPPLATGDSPPLNGDYPTRVWAAGEVFADRYRLTIPNSLENGRYPLWLGMYRSDTIERLPLTIDGDPQPNQLYQIGTIEIIAP